MFNVLNVANLTGYSGSLDKASSNPATQTYAFGQPTARAGQIFLSGGPPGGTAWLALLILMKRTITEVAVRIQWCIGLGLPQVTMV